MRVRIKICGVTSPEDARLAAALGADAIGVVLADSPRRVTTAEARAIFAALPPFVHGVAVLRQASLEELIEIAETLRPELLQCEPVDDVERFIGGKTRFLPVLHDEPELLEGARPFRDRTVLLEGAGRGGRGVAADWGRAAQLSRITRLVLAGGLTAENVGEALDRVAPHAVDVSSGVESAPGIKDPERIEAFIAAVRAGER